MNHLFHVLGRGLDKMFGSQGERWSECGGGRHGQRWETFLCVNSFKNEVL
jgi:hypothetical protein